MLKCASVYTYEIDSPEAALSDIKAQLDKKITLLDNTVGVIMCNIEFVTGGVMKYIGENLPFDVAGVTSASQSVNDEAGEIILTLFVMTSDEIRFKAGIIDSLSDSTDSTYERIKSAYEKEAKGETEQPGLAFTFIPFIYNFHSGDEYVRVWNKILPETPLFGTVATDDTIEFNDSKTIYNGEIKKDATSFILCYGNINPRFFTTILPEDKMLSLRGTVTKAKGNYIHEINDMTAKEFFSDAGITSLMITIPLMVTSTEAADVGKVPVIRGLTAYSDEGAGVLAGDVEENSTISVLSFDSDIVKATTKAEVEQIKSLPDVNGAIIFSCISRRFELLSVNEDLAELQIAKNTLEQDIPFIMGYSGGEVCPVLSTAGKRINRFHNFSAVILVI